jgi:hypothetical protein
MIERKDLEETTGRKGPEEKKSPEERVRTSPEERVRTSPEERARTDLEEMTGSMTEKTASPVRRGGITETTNTETTIET